MPAWSSWIRPAGRSRCITAGEQLTGTESECRRADGTRLVLRCSCSPVHDDEGALVADVAVVEDVTPSKVADAGPEAEPVRVLLVEDHAEEHAAQARDLLASAG